MFSPPRLIVMLLILIPAGLRLMDLQWNFASIGALSIFCGLYIKQRSLALAIPLAAMVISDIGLGLVHDKLDFYTTDPVRPIVYASYVLSICLGFSVRRYWQQTSTPQAEGGSLHETPSKVQWQRYIPVAGATLAGSLLFFVTTNFGVWLLEDMYPQTWEGLVSCYVGAIPFYRTTFASDLVFTLILVGGYELLFKARVPVTSASQLLYAE
ncbi:MAG: DUF6580 family putative transport protein [Planctomycetaceae bacterium]